MCAFVAIDIQHAMRMCFIVICGPPTPHSTIRFPHYLINGTILEKNKYWTQNVF